MSDGNRNKGGLGIAIAFALSGTGSGAFIVAYFYGANTQLEGIFLAVSVGALGLGFVAWAKELMPGGHYVEEREPLPSSVEQRRAAAEDFAESSEEIGRRRMLGRLLAGAAGLFGVAALFPIASLGPSPGRTLFRTAWTAGARVVTRSGLPIRLDDLREGALITVFPDGYTDSSDSQAVLIRVQPAELELQAGREDWAPDGAVAYSKVCTHAGCPVGLYEQEENRLFCPCHQSIFDALRGAEPTAGPATRPLPQLPLDVDEDGFLIARGDFPEPVGPGFWNAG
ncbi:MAG: Rieske 2Fe-2S domain-containing protein [Actinomycetota bacterium]